MHCNYTARPPTISTFYSSTASEPIEFTTQILTHDYGIWATAPTRTTTVAQRETSETTMSVLSVSESSASPAMPSSSSSSSTTFLSIYTTTVSSAPTTIIPSWPAVSDWPKTSGTTVVVVKEETVSPTNLYDSTTPSEVSNNAVTKSSHTTVNDSTFDGGSVTTGMGMESSTTTAATTTTATMSATVTDEKSFTDITVNATISNNTITTTLRPNVILDNSTVQGSNQMDTTIVRDINILSTSSSTPLLSSSSPSTALTTESNSSIGISEITIGDDVTTPSSGTTTFIGTKETATVKGYVTTTSKIASTDANAATTIQPFFTEYPDRSTISTSSFQSTINVSNGFFTVEGFTDTTTLTNTVSDGDFEGVTARNIPTTTASASSATTIGSHFENTTESIDCMKVSCLNGASCVSTSEGDKVCSVHLHAYQFA